jgi:hypothetical protein
MGFERIPIRASAGKELRICLKSSIFAAPTLFLYFLFFPLEPSIIQLLTAQHEANSSSEHSSDHGRQCAHPNRIIHVRRVEQSADSWEGMLSPNMPHICSHVLWQPSRTAPA